MPNWTPESGSALSHQISALQFEESLMQLMDEFLRGWFSGTDHEYQPGASVRFPMVDNVISQQMPVSTSQPSGLTIGVVYHDNPRHRLMTEPGERANRKRTLRTWTFMDLFVRGSVKAESSGHTSASLCRLGSDLLHGLLLMKANILPLSRAGVQNLRPSAPAVIPNTDNQLRKIRVRFCAFAPLREPVVVGAGGELVGIGGAVLGVP